MPSTRFAVLDFLRGAAVLGILVANLPAFALPRAAYFSPLAWGGTTPADIGVWFATFVLVEGKLRALFSLLFGASLVLAYDRAAADGQNAVAAQLRRMAVLFAFGCVHLYLIWWGDILAHYALCGVIALAFVSLPPRGLVVAAVLCAAGDLAMALEAQHALVESAARTTPQAIATWNAYAAAFGVPPPAEMLAEVAAMRGGFWAAMQWRWLHAPFPLAFLSQLGPQTLAAMLLGMAGLRSGFLRGTWPRRRYRQVALATLGITLPLYALTATATIRHGFDQRWVFFGSLVAGAVLRLPAALGYAALLILAFRPAGPLSTRVAGAGRVAFTTYLGTSLVMVAVFDGGGLFGRVPRAELYLLLVPAFTTMLAWPLPWLAGHRFGPFEWLWRSIARGAVQPWRKNAR